VTRFRIPYCLPSDDSIGMPPRTQRGPCSPREGHSTKTIDFSNSGSIASPVALSQITSRPDGQLHASSIAVSRASGFSDFRTRFHIPPARVQNPAWTQRCLLSVRVSTGSRMTFAPSLCGSLSPASVPSKRIFACVPSQNGLFSECPHLQRAYLPRKGYLFTSPHVRQ